MNRFEAISDGDHLRVIVTDCVAELQVPAILFSSHHLTHCLHCLLSHFPYLSGSLTYCKVFFPLVATQFSGTLHPDLLPLFFPT